ncbi:MAG: hypothetical protein ABEH56_01140 [Salinirussus sp.]
MFSFVPGILQPFTDTQQAEPVVANRVADRLAEGALGSPAQPYALDETCTVEFFQGNTPATCNYEGSTLNDRVGVTGRTSVNVTLLGNVTGDNEQERLCRANNRSLIVAGHSECSTTLAAGSPVPQGSSPITARRVAYLNGTAISIRVTTW